MSAEQAIARAAAINDRHRQDLSRHRQRSQARGTCMIVADSDVISTLAVDAEYAMNLISE
jgi:hypothetical protein